MTPSPSRKFRFPRNVFSRIVVAQLALVLVSLVVSGAIARHFFARQHLHQTSSQLGDALVLFERALPRSLTAEWCGQEAAGTSMRLTVIDRRGQVQCDSHHDPETMENHLDRPEVAEALRSGHGESLRFSATLHRTMVYAAISVPERQLILRAAVPVEILQNALHTFDVSLAGFLVLLAVVMSALAAWIGRRLLFPLGSLLVKAERVAADADLPSGGALTGQAAAAEPRGEEGSFADPSVESYGEWSELESSLESIRKDLAVKSERLTVEREELGTLMSAISDAILAVDAEGKPLFFNSRFALSFGGGDGLSKRTLSLGEIFRAPEIVDAYREALKEGRPASVSAIPYEHEERGGKRFYSLSVAPLRKTGTRAPSGVYGAVGVFHDVTELKRADQIRIDFVANVSHELRTPLTSIKGYTDTLIEDSRQGRPVEPGFLEVVARNVERLMALISDLLDLSALESTEVLHRAPISTVEVTERIVKQLAGTLGAKKQVVQSNCESQVVNADPRRLEQVLVNLLDNANKYTPAGSSIAVSWRRADDGSSDVLLRVKDNGPGIPREHQSRLFERFYRIDKARSREQGGTGLGLAIVKHIMQKHGGSVWVESELGAGATFICRFPA